jgi:phage tail-like protein
MARSSTQDPVEKFRFRVTVVAVSPNLTGAVESAAAVAASQFGGAVGKFANQLKVLARAGFSEIILPRQTISEISYRENIDAYRFIKVPGLVRYEPVIMKRGVTASRDFYDWLRQVNDELALLVVAGELTKDVKKGPVQSENFRKDVIIEVLNREGESVKGWYLFNAWPTSYKPGDDLNASGEEKLVEEMVLTYEVFLELEGGLKGFAKEIAKGAVESVVDSYFKKLPFSR